ncbi:MAG: DUF4129 domain-containing protein [Armatimonadetes bacterium]|nr:DUF4129 domain-containing protein [Armatimonadota bacterium]
MAVSDTPKRPSPVNQPKTTDLSSTEETQEEVSLWLYLAGLCAVLSAIYAVNFSLEIPEFGNMAFTGATAGFLLSYWLRSRGSGSRSLQRPIVLIVILLVIAFASSDRGMEWFWPSVVNGERQKAIQIVLVWFTVFWSFLLTSNASILFSIVPCFAMLALVSQTSTQAEIQNAFLLFVTATTFLMVHDNYLRTLNFQVKGRSEGQTKQLFGGQFQLTALCIMGALFFANIVAIPLRVIGQTLFNPSNLSSLTNSVDKTTALNTPSVQVSERNSIELASGPVTQSDTLLMRVLSPRGLYWRGTTFDFYTGTRFENRETNPATVTPTNEVKIENKEEAYLGLVGDSGERTFTGKLFALPISRLELNPLDMKNSQQVVQKFVIVGGSFSQFYGATSLSKIVVNADKVDVQSAGACNSSTVLPLNAEYQVTSVVADDDPSRLRTATSDTNAIPPPIRNTYLQTGPSNDPVRKAVMEAIKGKTNNYDKVQALIDYIGKTCKYNIQTPAAPRDRDSVEYFLFDRKMGYCDSFGAALTVMCRYAGVPARLASGFLAGDLKDGLYMVREKHKHIWTEAFFPEIGWVPFDATSAAEDISDYSTTKKQGGFWSWLKQDALRILLGILVVGLVGFILFNELLGRLPRGNRKQVDTTVYPATNRAITEAYILTCTLLKRYGVERTASMTPDEYAALVQQRADVALPTLSPLWKELTQLFKHFRYGTGVATEAEAQRAQALVQEVKATLKQVKKRDLALIQPKSPTVKA